MFLPFFFLKKNLALVTLSILLSTKNYYQTDTYVVSFIYLFLKISKT